MKWVPDAHYQYLCGELQTLTTKKSSEHPFLLTFLSIHIWCPCKCCIYVEKCYWKVMPKAFPRLCHFYGEYITHWILTWWCREQCCSSNVDSCWRWLYDGTSRLLPQLAWKWRRIIAVTSYTRAGASNYRQFDCLSNSLFSPSTKYIATFMFFSEGNLSVTCGLPSQGASDTKMVSVSWRHQVNINNVSHR